MKRFYLVLIGVAFACNDLPPIHVPGPTTAHPFSEEHGITASVPQAPGQVATLSRRNADARVVAFRILFDVGSSEDPAGKEGLTALTAAMTAESGTRDLTFAQLSRALYPMAASLSVHVDRDQTVFAVDVAATDLMRFQPLLRDIILAPRLDDESFSRLRGRQKSALEDELKGSDDESLGKEALQAFLYAGHPYGHPPVGTSAALAGMTLDDVKAHRARVFCRERVTVGVAGAFPEGFDKALAQELAALPGCSAPRPGLPEPERHHVMRVLIVDKPSADSTAISLGFPTTMTRTTDDFPSAYFFTSYVGLHRQSAGILYNRLREARGLNYGDYAYSEYFEQDDGTRFTAPNHARREQMVSMWIRPVKPQNALFALRGALFYWQKAVEEGVSDAEIVRFRNFVSRYLSLEQQTESRRLGFALDDKTYRAATPFSERMRTAWAGLDAAKLKEVVKRDLSEAGFAIVLVSKDGAALKKALASGGKSPAVYDAPKGKEVTDEDKLIEALPLGLKEANIKVVPVAELFAK